MKVLALIPARGGSKRLPRKNIKPRLFDVPLIGYAIRAAKEVEEIDLVAVSTEDPEIAEYSIEHGAVVIERPEHLAADITPMFQVVRHALLQAPLETPDVLMLLQPTSPLRTADDIRGALKILQDPCCEGVISVMESDEPTAYVLGHAGRLRKVVHKTAAYRYVHINGAIFAPRVTAPDYGDEWWLDMTRGVTYGYVMPASRSIDIDTKDDLEFARLLMARSRAASELDASV